MTDPGGVPFFWIDAFADRRFSGNPAAVCLLDHPAEADWMQSVATEIGISETAFVWPDDGALSLRWFTPTTEVDLCGHATVAAAHALRESGRVADGSTVRFCTRSGELAARLDGAVVELDLPADRSVVPSAAPPHGWSELIDIEGPVVDAFASELTCTVVLSDADAVVGTVPHLAAIAAQPYRVLYVTAACAEGDADYALRVFGPAVGVDEDPVTGSAQCVLGPYWSGRLGRTVLTAVQRSKRGGRMRVTVAGDRVRVAGGAVTVLAGKVTQP